MGKDGDGKAAAIRPLNKYYDTREIAECPSDIGQPMHGIENIYREWGSSYTATSGNNIYSIALLSSRKPKTLDFYDQSDKKKIVSGDHNLGRIVYGHPVWLVGTGMERGGE